MDKKNTMLLTVIAVATLLVAVVGATFAYFSLTTNTTNDSQASNLNGQVGELNIGNIAVTNPTTEALKVELTAAEMLQSKQGTTYWATKTGANYVESEEKNTVAKVEVTGGEATYVYECKVTTTIEIGNLTSDAEGSKNLLDAVGLQAADAKLTLSTEESTGVTLPGTHEWDATALKSAKDDSEGKINAETTFTITGPGSKEIKAAFYIANTAASQNYLADRGLTLKISNTAVDCKLTSTGE